MSDEDSDSVALWADDSTNGNSKCVILQPDFIRGGKG